MRAVRLAIVIPLLSAIFVLAVGESRLGQQPHAQVTAATGPAPLTAPAAPGRPQPFATIGALPALLPAPGTQLVAVPTGQATPREFRCTCSGPGNPTQWAGVVASSSYILARQSARAQCANFGINANAQSPFIPPVTSAFSSRPSLSTGSAITSRAQLATTVTEITQEQQNQALLEQVHGRCSACACD